MRGLSRRLLLKKSASTQSERQMLTKLRSECSNDFNSKCENMIKDLFDSDQFMVEYKKVHPQNQEEIEHHIHVLQPSAWPISSQFNKELKIPTEISTI